VGEVAVAEGGDGEGGEVGEGHEGTIAEASFGRQVPPRSIGFGRAPLDAPEALLFALDVLCRGWGDGFLRRTS
jgi:hypothetical protein